MLHSSDPINCIVSLIKETQLAIVVWDPVVVTTQLPPNSLAILRDQLLPVITFITPTLDEAAVLLDRPVVSLDDMKCAAQDLHSLGAKCVLIQGNYLALDASQQTQTNNAMDNDVVDVLFDGMDFTLFKSPRVPIKTAYSTRCLLSAAITALLAHGIDMKRAVQDAIAYTRFVVRKSWTCDLNNDVLKLKRTLSAFGNQLPKESLKTTEITKSLVINKQKQKPPLESRDNIVLVKNHSWVEEPRIFPQQRSFVQLLKTVCAQEWVSVLPLCFHFIS
jgi:hydroxymethylpyrimidine kinase/phosphomethylpyrimidine kinase